MKRQRQVKMIEEPILDRGFRKNPTKLKTKKFDWKPFISEDYYYPNQRAQVILM